MRLYCIVPCSSPTAKRLVRLRSGAAVACGRAPPEIDHWRDNEKQDRDRRQLRLSEAQPDHRRLIVGPPEEHDQLRDAVKDEGGDAKDPVGHPSPPWQEQSRQYREGGQAFI